MRRIATKAAIMGVLAAAALVVGAGPAAAASITVAGGGSFTAAAGTVTLKAGVAMSCTGSTASGNVTPGSYTVPTIIGAITASTWTSCTALGAPSFPSQTGTWNIVATAPPVGGVSPVEVSNIDATIQVPAVGCTLTVTGTAGANFNNGTQVLQLTGGDTLNVAKSGFCLGVTSTGSFTASYAVSATAPVTIS